MNEQNRFVLVSGMDRSLRGKILSAV